MKNYYIYFNLKRIYINDEKTRYFISTTGDVYNEDTRSLMAGGKDKNGYHIISLSLHAKKYTRKVHRLVAEAFMPNPNNLPEVNHIDGDKWNNDVDNLELVTTAENVHHASRLNLRKSTLTEEKVKMICEKLQNGERPSFIARQLKLKPAIIIKIRNRIIWKTISKDYEFPKTYSALSGEESPSSVITRKQAEYICTLFQNKMRPMEVSRQLGINFGIVYNIFKRYTWREVSKYYMF